MNEQEKPSNDRLERLLRRWGSKLAAEEAEVGPAPAPPRRTIMLWPAILRWAPAAAAAVLLMAVALLLWGPLRPGRTTEAGAPATARLDEAASLRAELTKARQQHRTRRKAYEAATQSLSVNSAEAEKAAARAEGLQERVQTLTGELAAARRQVGQMEDRMAGERRSVKRAAEVLKEWQENKKDLAALKTDVAEGKAGLNDARGRLATAEGEVSRLRKLHEGAVSAGKKGQKEHEQTRRRLQAAVEEIARIRGLYDGAVVEGQKAQIELMKRRARRFAMVEELQRVYLALVGSDVRPAGPGEAMARQAVAGAALRAVHGGLPARQSAARRRRLLERCAELRPSVRTGPAGELLDKLEVVLMRLDLLDPTDPAAVKSFAELVRGGGLTGQIDKALTSGGEGRHVRTWLLEAKLVLMGADRVG